MHYYVFSLVISRGFKEIVRTNERKQIKKAFGNPYSESLKKEEILFSTCWKPVQNKTK
jgi:hypothetical protein